MADFIRAQLSAWRSLDPKQDKVTNTLYFRRNLGVDLDGPGWDALCLDILNAYRVGESIYARGADRYMCKLYDMEDAEPRQPKATVEQNGSDAVAGPREVALCLSFRGELNLARQRGRIFLGPFSNGPLGARPTLAEMNTCLALADRLADIGGVDIDWCVHSPTTLLQGGTLGDSFKPVRHSWVDDAWDTVRSRGLPPATRVTDTHNG